MFKQAKNKRKRGRRWTIKGNELIEFQIIFSPILTPRLATWWSTGSSTTWLTSTSTRSTPSGCQPSTPTVKASCPKRLPPGEKYTFLLEERFGAEFQAAKQCDQIGRFIGPWATFQSLWQQLVFLGNVKVSTSLIFQVKTFLGNFYRHLATFYWSHCC